MGKVGFKHRAPPPPDRPARAGSLDKIGLGPKGSYLFAENFISDWEIQSPPFLPKQFFVFPFPS